MGLADNTVIEGVKAALDHEVERLDGEVDAAKRRAADLTRERDNVKKALRALTTTRERPVSKKKATKIAEATMARVIESLPDGEFTTKQAVAVKNPNDSESLVGEVIRQARDAGALRMKRRDGLSFVYEKVES